MATSRADVDVPVDWLPSWEFPAAGADALESLAKPLAFARLAESPPPHRLHLVLQIFLI